MGRLVGWRSAGAGGKLGRQRCHVTERERPMSSLSDTFNKLAQWTAHHAGRPVAFAMAVGAIVIWVLSGPIFQWSDTWQLVINTGTIDRDLPDGVPNSEHPEP